MSVFESVRKLITGDVAHDAADGGNPIKIGGKASTERPAAVANGDRVNAWLTEYGRVVVSPGAWGEEMYALAARTATPTSVLESNPGAKGVYIVVYVTAKASTMSLWPILYWMPPTATVGNEVPSRVIWQAPAALSDVGTYAYLLYPGAADYAHPSFPGLAEAQSIPMPRKWKLEMSHGNANSVTYQVYYEYLF